MNIRIYRIYKYRIKNTILAELFMGADGYAEMEKKIQKRHSYCGKYTDKRESGENPICIYVINDL